MSLYKTFKTDENIERTGVVLEYGLNSKGQPIQIRIARAGGNNARYNKTLEVKTKPYRRQIQNETLDDVIGRRVFREVYAEAVILGWDGVEDAEGNPMPFTKDNCIKLLTDLPDLFDDIREQAQKAALFRAEILENDAGN